MAHALPARVLVAVGLLSASALALEVAWVRVLSVALWYHFASLVVSAAVLGFGLSGMLLALFPTWLQGDVQRRGTLMATAGAASVVVGLAALSAVPFDPFRLMLEPVQLVYALVWWTAITAPFLGIGACIGLLLAAHSAQIGRLYGADLLGAGLGAGAVVLAFRPLGGSGTVVACAALAFASAAALGGRRRVAAPAVVGLIGCLVLLPNADDWLEVRLTSDKQAAPGMSMERFLADPGRRVHSSWNALSRVDLVRGDQGMHILIDGGAAWVRVPSLGKPLDELPPMRDIAALPMVVAPPESVLVIGSGAGWEVVAAYTHGAERITAVELNPGITDLLDDELAEATRGLFASPRVELVTGEGRSFLARATERWDAIIGMHTISNAATASGSGRLAEGHLFTEEAFDDYLAHLTDDGLLYLTRPEEQFPKLVLTARDALARAGAADPGAHLAVVRTRPQPGDAYSFTAGLLVGRSPFTDEQVRALRAEASALSLDVLLADGLGAAPYPELVAGGSAAHWAQELGVDMRPATDVRPFFNQRRTWSSLRPSDLRDVLSQGDRGRRALEDRPVAEVSLVVLALLAVVVAAACTLLPLWLGRRRLTAPRRTPLLGYFALLGVSYLFVELALVHSLTLFLGHPTLAFAVVVGAMLIASGVGARMSERVDARAPAVVALGAALVVTTALLVPPLVDGALAAPVGVRVALAAVAVGPVGVALGMPFPLGMSLCGRTAPALLPVAWGVNGFASVLGGVGCLMLSTAWGFSAVLLLGALLYAVAAALLWTASQALESP